MVKGSNSVKNKKLHSSKPYDVSNSFVKKVTSHVTNLLPQPTWFSKWFSSNADDGHRREALNSNDSSSEDDDDDNTNIHPPPSKRAKIPLNQQFPPNSFIISPVNDEAPNQRAGTSRMPKEHFVNDGAVAGPSGINRRPPIVSSTPNVEPTSASLLPSSERKLNGDDQSESSESTSGCSSLVPQANRQFQASEIASSNLSARRRSIDEKLNFTGHLQSPRSLFSDRSYSRSPRLNSSLSRRRPSFNVSTFGSPVRAQDRIALQSRIVNSPFYAGRTTFGGASAYRKWKDSIQSPSEVSAVKRCDVQVKPTNCEADTLSTMSTTARRILEALEQFSTPVLDAKRIPVQPSTPPLGSKRKRPNEASLSPSLRTGQIPRTPNSARPLMVPTVPDLLKMKHREKLQDTMEAARLIAAASSINSTPVCPSTPNRGYRLRFEEDEKSGKHGGKIRSKEKELEEETVEEVNLPNISLPVTSLPKFDFVVPPAPVSTSAIVSTFKFASPITVTENARTSKPIDNFTFSKPLSIGNKDTVNHNTKKVNCIGTSIPNCPVKLSEMQFKSGSESKLVSTGKSISHKNNSQNSSEVVFGIKVAGELKTGSVMDILGKMSNSVGDKDSKQVVSGSSGGSLDMFKPTPGMWECSSCMIRNKSDVTKCVCCETSRTAVSAPNSKTTSIIETWICKLCHTSNAHNLKLCSKCSADNVQSSSQLKEPALQQEKPQTSVSDFGNKFKPPSGTWECSTCLVRNPESLTQCQACETKRPGFANKSSTTPASLLSKPATGSGFGEMFKKPEGSWECPDCMVQNKSDSLKCVACERAKPGTETKTASTTKFNFAIPAEASGFKFGLDKAGDTSKESAIQPSSAQGFKFGETKVTTASNFTFGVNASVVQNVTKSDSGTSNTSTLAAPSFNIGTTAFSSPIPSVTVKPSDTTTFTQPGFTFGVSQVPKFQSPAPSETRKPEEVPKKRRASDTGETVVESKAIKPKEEKGTVCFVKPASSDTATTVAKNTEEKSEQKDQPAKKVTFSLGSSYSDSTNLTNEKPNTATKAAECAKPSFSFGASSAGLNFNSGKPASFSFSSPTGTATIFGNSAPVTTANADTNSTTAVSTVAATSTVSTPFMLGASKSPATFGSTSSNLAFGQPPTTTSTATLSFSSGLKTSTFSFGSQSKPFSVGGNDSATTTSKSQTPAFGSATISAFGTSTTATAPTTVTTTSIPTTTSTATSSVASPSLPSFGTPTCTPNFSLGAKSTIPAFGTSNTTTSASTTTSMSFSSIASPNFSSTFSDQNKSASKSVSSAAPFAFGSSTSNSTSSLGTSAAPFSFGSTQNDQGLASKGIFGFGAPSNNATLGSGTAPSTGFGFVSNNPTPTYNFGSSASAPNPAAPSLFGSSSNNVQASTAGPIFGVTSTGTFGNNNPNSGGSNSSASFSTPAFNFGASGTQPSSAVFGFTGSPSTSGQSFAASTPNFNLGQSQAPAQTTGQPTLLTFNPNVRPTFNFTKGETPAFTASAPPVSTPAPGSRRIKKAVRRTHLR